VKHDLRTSVHHVDIVHNSL